MPSPPAGPVTGVMVEPRGPVTGPLTGPLNVRESADPGRGVRPVPAPPADRQVPDVPPWFPVVARWLPVAVLQPLP